MEIQTIGTPLLWSAFSLTILVMLAIDLGLFHREAHEVKFREAVSWTIVWIALALLFNVAIYVVVGSRPAVEFLTGYLIEKSLSVDNIFVILVLFSFFGVPKAYQHRVLFWGVLGALVMRAVFIGAGTALVQRFHWVMYVFGVILVVTAIKLLVQRNEEVHPERNPIVRLFRRFVRTSNNYDGAKFLTVENGRRVATPLMVVLVAIEATDLVFAVDSIPAIFAITTDPFIVYTSNVFAIVGLRALYFVLAGVMDKFRYLKIGLSAILGFVGVKMLVVDIYKIPIVSSLAVIASILIIAVIASLVANRRADDLRIDAA